MKQHINTSDQKGHDFEVLYKAMVQSEDYLARIASLENKLVKLTSLREETGKYNKLRNDAEFSVNKLTDEYLDEFYDLDEIEELLKD